MNNNLTLLIEKMKDLMLKKKPQQQERPASKMEKVKKEEQKNADKQIKNMAYEH